jgi:hypothetical protein
MQDLLPGILSQIDPENFAGLKKVLGATQAAAGAAPAAAAGGGGEEMPEVADFEAVAGVDE